MEQTASHPTDTVFSKADEQRYQQLTALYIDGKSDAAQENEFQKLRKKKIAARNEREKCIAQLIKDIAEKNISLAELFQAGLKVPAIVELYSDSEILKAAKSINASPAANAAEPAPYKTAGKKREVKGYIRSLKNSEETGVWRAGPPSFFKDEGGLDAYERGELVDKWLVDPKDESSKIKLLKSLEKKCGKAPTQEQLGDITSGDFTKG